MGGTSIRFRNIIKRYMFVFGWVTWILLIINLCYPPYLKKSNGITKSVNLQSQLYKETIKVALTRYIEKSIIALGIVCAELSWRKRFCQ